MSSNRGLLKVLLDRGLARLGDSYLNFVYSLALSRSSGRFTGTKVSDRILLQAARISGIRAVLPKRMRRNEVANAIEALIVYAWLKNEVGIDETVEVLAKNMAAPPAAIAQVAMSAVMRLEARNEWPS